MRCAFRSIGSLDLEEDPFLLIAMLLMVGITFCSLGTVNAYSLVAVRATQVYADHTGDLRNSSTLPWSVISSGGMGGSADGYTIHSTLGQPVAGSVTAEPYHLTSGFWTEIIESIKKFFNFLPLILKQVTSPQSNSKYDQVHIQQAAPDHILC